MPPASMADQVIIEIDKLLNQWTVTKKLDSHFDFSQRLALSDDERTFLSQCRQDGWNKETLDEMQAWWENGVQMRQFPIGVEIDGEVFIAVGNHRAESMRRAGMTGSCIIVGDGLTNKDKLLLLQKLANVSNSKHTNDKRTDSMNDVVMQAGGAWDSVKNVDMGSQNPIGVNERYWNQAYNTAATLEESEIVQRDWYEDWMNQNKPNSFSYPAIRTKIYNRALTSKSGQGGLLPLDAKQMNLRFGMAFPGYGWDEKKYKFENGEDIHQMSTTWNNRVANSPLNIRRTILDNYYQLDGTIEVSNKHEVHVVVEGYTASTLDGRKGHIKQWLETISKYNQNERVKKHGIPSVTKVLFIKSINNVGDSDFAFEMNTMTREFVPSGDAQLSLETASSREDIVTVTEKKCSTCRETKEASEFYTCRPPNSKDGLQPRCKPCCKEYEARAASKRKIAATANSNKSSSSQWDGTIFIGGE
tara:strand:+ start:2565 stop:3983 length:1419 start_codon:yes stop_codon:yes gene_type:complete